MFYCRAANIPSFKRTLARIEKGEAKLEKKSEVQLVGERGLLTCSLLRKS